MNRIMKTKDARASLTSTVLDLQRIEDGHQLFSTRSITPFLAGRITNEMKFAKLQITNLKGYLTYSTNNFKKKPRRVNK